MSKSKYEIGDRIPGTNLVVRGKMILANGSVRYFLQIGESNNSLTLNDDDILINPETLDLNEWLDD
ncbi:MAG: hypothetical protein HC930_01315 [Hydrococcus sp. SU_1_0]|nr:hypothetical protein [Hydrococcus sp. SU_1_0]